MNFEKELIYLLQKEFPLSSKPFEELAKKLNTTEEKILNLLKAWEKEGKLRQISAIFNPGFFKHSSSLFAFKVDNDNLSLAIEVINSHPGVSHNYLREHEFNLWFTLVVPPEKDLFKEVEELFKRSRAYDFLYLPILKVFKISAVFNVDEINEENGVFQSQQTKKEGEFTERDKLFVKVLQEPLPLTSEPFKELAKRLNCTEEEIFEWINLMKEKGGLRRFGALFKHHKMGLKRNVLVAWRVPEERIEEVGSALARYPFITHCYLRKSYPHWSYNLYTMCHFKEREEEENSLKRLSEEIQIQEFLPLKTLQELKKIRLKLFYC